MKTNQNKVRQHRRTHEGAPVGHMTPVETLKSVLNAHLLWEDTFYVDGKSNAEAMTDAVDAALKADWPATMEAIYDARRNMNIRHAPLMAAVRVSRDARVLSDIGFRDGAKRLLLDVIQRADEISEVYAMAGGRKASHFVHATLRAKLEQTKAEGGFDEYQFAKYRGEGKTFSLRDVVFVTHPNPEKNPLVDKIAKDTLATPDTWEVGLSKGGDKRAVFENLLLDRKLGAMALLRNLRNMADAGVSTDLIRASLRAANWERVLPFRFVAAMQAAPQFAAELDAAFKIAVSNSVPLRGQTAVLVDTSGSMDAVLSTKSTIRLHQAGAALAAAVNGDLVDLFQWADRTMQVPNWRSLASVMDMRSGRVGHGTRIDQAIAHALSRKVKYDRVIVISDLQFHDYRKSAYFGSSGIPTLPDGVKGYTINLNSYASPGLMYGDWTHLTGFSAQTIRFIAEMERVA